jgi:hypothetical protein
MSLNKKTLFRLIISAALALLLGWLVFGSPLLAHADAILTIEPITWNVVGLDSNNVNVGPNNFPVGVRVRNNGDAPATNVTVDFVWDTLDPYIALRSGSLDPITTSSIAAGGFADFYFEIEITRDANAYDHTREYHVSVSSTETSPISTSTPREIYVEHLISQSRNSTTDVLLDTVSVAPGGTMTLMLGETYDIELEGSTATNGYEQIESYINFPNTIFQINSVASTYTANSGTDPDAASKVYADGCSWENDPNSPNYRSCLGNITVNYNVTIIGGAGTSEILNTLIYDFSGSSYHYNSDFSVAGRIAAIVDPSLVTIDKNFAPDPTSVTGTSTLTFTLSNPNDVAISVPQTAAVRQPLHPPQVRVQSRSQMAQSRQMEAARLVFRCRRPLSELMTIPAAICSSGQPIPATRPAVAWLSTMILRRHPAHLGSSWPPGHFRD